MKKNISNILFNFLSHGISVLELQGCLKIVEHLAFGGLSGGPSSGAFGVAVGCVSASLLGRREGSKTVPSVAAIGCVGMSLLGQAGRQQGQCAYLKRSLIRLGWVRNP